MNRSIYKMLSNMEQRGCTIRVHHNRNLVDSRKPAKRDNILPNGGRTIIQIDVPYESGVRTVNGFSHCVTSDQFSRDAGANAAARRALRNLHALCGRECVKRLVADVPEPTVQVKPTATTAS